VYSVKLTPQEVAYLEDRSVPHTDVRLLYHIGYFPQGSYSYVAAKEQPGIELSVNNNGNYSELFQALLSGTATPLDELV
jgi:hypothetical protein